MTFRKPLLMLLCLGMLLAYSNAAWADSFQTSDSNQAAPVATSAQAFAAADQELGTVHKEATLAEVDALSLWNAEPAANEEVQVRSEFQIAPAPEVESFRVVMPEPASWILTVGLLMFLSATRRRRK